MMVYVIGVKDVCVCLCRMENINQANREERMNEAPSASAGSGLF